MFRPFRCVKKYLDTTIIFSTKIVLFVFVHAASSIVSRLGEVSRQWVLYALGFKQPIIAWTAKAPDGNLPDQKGETTVHF
jgi:hypothetical protein